MHRDPPPATYGVELFSLACDLARLSAGAPPAPISSEEISSEEISRGLSAGARCDYCDALAEPGDEDHACATCRAEIEAEREAERVYAEAERLYGAAAAREQALRRADRQAGYEER